MRDMRTIARADQEYPELLRQIHDPPETLHIEGRIPPSGPFLAVVGSRKPSAYGRAAARGLCESLARSGVVIVSGLAYGIDAIAHEAAVSCGAPTIGIIGSGMDRANFYPARNFELSQRIVASGGAVMSEYPPGTEARNWHFPVRNRLIAGMCTGVLVVEAAQKSGSLITARAALAENREVFAVPGPITSPLSAGPNNLLKMGATPATCADDILQVLGVRARETPSREPVRADSPEEAAILAALSPEPLHIDDLARAAGLPSPKAAATLTLMEMKGSARHVGGLHYISFS